MLVKDLIKIFKRMDETEHVAAFWMTSRQVRLLASQMPVRINPRESEMIIEMLENDDNYVKTHLERHAMTKIHESVQHLEYIPRYRSGGDDEI